MTLSNYVLAVYLSLMLLLLLLVSVQPFPVLFVWFVKRKLISDV